MSWQLCSFSVSVNNCICSLPVLCSTGGPLHPFAARCYWWLVRVTSADEYSADPSLHLQSGCFRFRCREYDCGLGRQSKLSHSLSPSMAEHCAVCLPTLRLRVCLWWTAAPVLSGFGCGMETQMTPFSAVLSDAVCTLRTVLVEWDGTWACLHCVRGGTGIRPKQLLFWPERQT